MTTTGWTSCKNKMAGSLSRLQEMKDGGPADATPTYLEMKLAEG